MKVNLSYSITENNIILFVNGSHYNLNRKSPNAEEKSVADKVYAAIKAEDNEEVVKLLAPGKTIIERYANGKFYVMNTGEVFMKGNIDMAIPKRLANQLIKFAKESLPVEPLLNFWENLKLNPSADSISELYDCLEVNHHPITSDGCFLAYKKVTRKGEILVDSHSGTMDNSIGRIVEIDRAKVDSNRNNTCSTGLHVASFEYAKGFSGDVLVVVKINPKHVVSVPTDYKAQKMRVCQYEVLSYCTQGEIKKGIAEEKKVYKTNMPGKEIDLRNKTVKEIITIVRANGHPQFIPMITPAILKDKKGVIKKAATALANLGFKVQTENGVVEISPNSKKATKPLTKDQIVKMVHDLLKTKLDANDNDFQNNPDIVDELDELDRVEIIMEFEKMFNINIKDDVAEHLYTIDDFVNHIKKALS